MSTVIAQFKDGSRLEFSHGVFDAWCVYLTRPNVPRHRPRDIEYFTTLCALSERHGPERLYADFVAVYDLTTRKVDEAVLNVIRLQSRSYAEDALEFSIVMVTIYAGMIAEENKRFTRLGRRVKRLGVYQILNLRMPPEVAANHSRGKRWQEIARECAQYGF